MRAHSRCPGPRVLFGTARIIESMENPGLRHSGRSERTEPERMVLAGYRLLWWPGLALGLLIHIVAVNALLRHLGLLVSPFYGFLGTVAFAAIQFAAAIGVRLVVQRLGKNGVAQKWSLKTAPTGLLIGEFFLIIATMTLLRIAYSWPKVMVQVLNPALWDPQLVALDRLLFFGLDPNEFLLTIFEGSPAFISALLDKYYGIFIFTQSIGAAWFLCDPRARLRAAFGAGLIGLWMIGTWCYVAVPALGPAYVFADFPQRLSSVFPVAAQAQAALYGNYMAVKGLASGEHALIIPDFGIAAMPSLHVATHLFLYLWAVFAKSKLRPVFLAMTLLTFVGSVATCWHYAVDGLAGAIVAAIAFGLAVMAARILRGGQAPSICDL